MTYRDWAHKGSEQDDVFKRLIAEVLFSFLKQRKYTVSELGLKDLRCDMSNFFSRYIKTEARINIPLLDALDDKEMWKIARETRSIDISFLDINRNIVLSCMS